MKQLRHGRLLGALLFTFAGAQSAGCMEHEIDGNTAREEFADQQLASLAKAACEGDVAGVERALKRGASPNGQGVESVTPLAWAVNCENLSGIEALLKAGGNPNQLIGDDFSPTFAAATMWNPAILKILLKHGGDPNAYRKGDLSKTALAEALSVGIDGHGWDNFYALLDAGADINRADEMGRTIATKAAALRQYDIVVELLDRGYSYDLPGLGRYLQVGEVNAAAFPEAAASKAKAIAMLEKKGVRFPVPPL